MFAPVTVTLKALDTCVNAAVLYSCETRGAKSLIKIDAVNKNGIKTTLSLKQNTPNDILYVESGLSSLKGNAYKRQYRFCAKILKDVAISQIYQQAIECSLPYIIHDAKLHNDYKDADECMRCYDHLDKAKRLQNIRTKGAEDPESIPGTYLHVETTNFVTATKSRKC